MGNMYNLLRDTCLFCHRFKVSRPVVRFYFSLRNSRVPTPFKQLAKYVAKFRLLERGLLDAAQGVDDLQIRVSIEKKKATANKGKGKKNETDDSDESSDDEKEKAGVAVLDETLEQFAMRVNLYVAVHLGRSSASTRDHYKDGMVYKARKDLINEFLKVSFSTKCRNDGCGRCVT
jgi:hypothetical protein